MRKYIIASVFWTIVSGAFAQNMTDIAVMNDQSAGNELVQSGRSTVR